MEEEECVENWFYGWVEQPTNGMKKESTNKLISLIGIILGLLGVIAFILGHLWPLFLSGGRFSDLLWHNWIFGILGIFSLALQIFGLLRWFGASGRTNAATTFRAWRTNWLAQFTHAFLQFVFLIIYVIMYFVTTNFSVPDQKWYYASFFAGGTMFAILAVSFVTFAKGWWQIYDPEAQLRCEYWNLFGNDRDAEMPEEEEEMAEEETIEEDEDDFF